MKGYTNTLYQLVGKIIKVKVQQLTGTGTNLRTEKFLVTRAYPHYVRAVRTCENGTIITECFTKGELVQMGIVQPRKKAHYGIGEREGYRVEGKENR